MSTTPDGSNKGKDANWEYSRASMWTVRSRLAADGRQLGGGKMRKSHKYALAVIGCLAFAPGAQAYFNDKKPISITATGISTRSIFKPFMEVMHGLFRQDYP
ncbi:MAG: hypothetical protein RLT05_30735, partial [Bauldia litoralis]